MKTLREKIKEKLSDIYHSAEDDSYSEYRGADYDVDAILHVIEEALPKKEDEYVTYTRRGRTYTHRRHIPAIARNQLLSDIRRILGGK